MAIMKTWRRHASSAYLIILVLGENVTILGLYLKMLGFGEDKRASLHPDLRLGHEPTIDHIDVVIVQLIAVEILFGSRYPCHLDVERAVLGMELIALRRGEQIGRAHV